MSQDKNSSAASININVTSPEAHTYFSSIVLPQPTSHKGENGKVLVIGGSELFHAASKWSLDIASRLVDMVFYSSVPENNELVKQAKGEFWNGIVIRREDVDSYVEEADAIVIGPGMTRTPDTAEIVDRLAATYPDKKWVADAGALQMISPKLLTPSMIITPHQQEFSQLLKRVDIPALTEKPTDEEYQATAAKLGGVTVILKSAVDVVFSPTHTIHIAGGNPGLTKGGTGDVLAGLAAGLYANNDQWNAAIMASIASKKASEELAESVGPFFNASDLVAQLPQTLWNLCPEEKNEISV